MKYLIILSLLSLFACEKEKLPTTPTVINGTVVDENDVPIPNVKVEFFGTEYLGFRGGSGQTFYLEKNSDENGTFSFSQIIPNETDVITLVGLGVRDSIGFIRIPIGFKYDYYLNGQLVPPPGGSIQFSNRNNLFGTTSTVKIKQTKE